MFGFFKNRRRAKLRSQPVPETWRASLSARFPLFQKLSVAAQQELLEHIHVFLAEKRFEGCGGLELTPEMKVLIAAQACVLLLRRETDYYPRLRTILVYPSSYQAKSMKQSSHGVVTEEESERLGESWTDGTVVLSWQSTWAGAADPKDGQNVVLHEFAHQLDQEDGTGDGAPILERRGCYTTWARVLGGEYEALQAAAKQGRKTVMDKYGATLPAEFFAVATECFFEKPVQLKKKHPELYAELSTYYRQDPAGLVQPPLAPASVS